MEGRSWPHPPLVMEEVDHPHPLPLPLPRRHPSLQTLMVRIQETTPPPKHFRLLMSYWLECLFICSKFPPAIEASAAAATGNSVTSKKKKNKSKKKKQPPSGSAASTTTATSSGMTSSTSNVVAAVPSSTGLSGKRGSPEGPAPAALDNVEYWSSGEEDLEFHDAQSELPGQSCDHHNTYDYIRVIIK